MQDGKVAEKDTKIRIHEVSHVNNFTQNKQLR